MRRSKDDSHLLSAFEKHPTPNHLALIEGMEHPLVLKHNDTQGDRIGRTTVLDVDRPTERLSILRQFNSRESDGVRDNFLIGAGFQWWKGLHSFRPVTVDNVQWARLVSRTGWRLCDEELRDLIRLRRVFRLLTRHRGLPKCRRG